MHRPSECTVMHGMHCAAENAMQCTEREMHRVAACDLRKMAQKGCRKFGQSFVLQQLARKLVPLAARRSPRQPHDVGRAAACRYQIPRRRPPRSSKRMLARTCSECSLFAEGELGGAPVPEALWNALEIQTTVSKETLQIPDVEDLPQQTNPAFLCTARLFEAESNHSDHRQQWIVPSRTAAAHENPQESPFGHPVIAKVSLPTEAQEN